MTLYEYELNIYVNIDYVPECGVALLIKVGDVYTYMYVCYD